MKKYLSLAAVVGAIAFASASYLAHAQQPAAPAAEAPAAAPAPGTAMEANVPVVASDYAKDRTECDALASAPSTEGAAPSETDKAAALKKCLAAKGHSIEEITKEEAKAPAAAPEATTAPAAPAAQ